MFQLAFAERPTGARRTLLVVLAVAIPLLAAFNALCWLLDYALFPGFTRVSVREPVFVVGHARSGTSLLHRLMSRDGERFSTFLTWELFLPSIAQRKLVRALGRLDARLGSPLGRRIRAWEDRTFAKGREMHPMSLGGPEEDEFLLALSCASGVWVLIFPYWRELQHFYYVDAMEPARRRRILRFYRDCVRRQLYCNGAEKIHLSKNPTFSGRVEALLETFPDARFVVCVRSPYETIPSLLKMMTRNWKAARCSPERIDDSRRALAEQSFHTYRHPLEVLARHPETRFAIADYRELVAAPKRAVAAVYAALGLPLTPAYEHSLGAEEKRSREHRAEHVYSLGEFGLEPGEIRERLGDLFERFGWDAEGR
ncbi:MAG: sulfotransferase [Proteobacteria bacterium]|nr:MAG: sulfotransferase [Pseudomonadota bacterium]